MPTNREVQISRVLTDIAIEAFQSVGQTGSNVLFPIVPVEVEAGGYYVVDKASWLQNYSTEHSRLAPPNEIGWKVSSDSYVCKMYGLRNLVSNHDLVNADTAVDLRNRSMRNVMQALLRAKEIRVANATVTSGGPGGIAALTGADSWDAVNSANIITHIASARAYFKINALPYPNTVVIGDQPYEQMRMNSRLLEYFKYTVPGARVSDDNLQTLFGVNRMVVADTYYNNAREGQAASLVSAWKKNVVFAYVDPKPMTKQTATYGLTFAMKGDGLYSGANDMGISGKEYQHPDAGVNGTYFDAGFWHDEKVVGRELSYVINTTSGF